MLRRLSPSILWHLLLSSHRFPAPVASCSFEASNSSSLSLFLEEIDDVAKTLGVTRENVIEMEQLLLDATRYAEMCKNAWATAQTLSIDAWVSSIESALGEGTMGYTERS